MSNNAIQENPQNTKHKEDTCSQTESQIFNLTQELTYIITQDQWDNKPKKKDSNSSTTTDEEMQELIKV